MTKNGLKARVFTLTLAPTLIIGLFLSIFFTINRYNDLENQLVERNFQTSFKSMHFFQNWTSKRG